MSSINESINDSPQFSNERKLFAFGYQARVGKDTAAEYLRTKYGGKRFAFSTALYDILNFAQTRCGFPLQKDRQFLQYIGTEWARKQESDVWVNILINELKKFMEESPTENIYITDVRFPNEFNALKELGFTMIQIKGDIKSEFGSGSNMHASEIALSEYKDEMWHKIVENDDTLNVFYSKLEELLNNKTI